MQLTRLSSVLPRLRWPQIPGSVLLCNVFIQSHFASQDGGAHLACALGMHGHQMIHHFSPWVHFFTLPTFLHLLWLFCLLLCWLLCLLLLLGRLLFLYGLLGLCWLL
jgi:hypothetical protein